jgi:hypothetical protein
MSDDDGFLRRLAKRAIELKDKAVAYPSTLLTPATEQQKLQNDIAVAQARNKVEQFAVPKAAWAIQNVPGMSALNDAVNFRTVPKDVGELEPVRQPIQQEREFSNDKDKEEYIARVRKAMENAKQ